MPNISKTAATLFGLSLLLASAPANADGLKLQLTNVPEWKAVYGRVESKDNVAARARIGGTIVELNVTEGDTVKAGQQIAIVKDDKIDFQIAATNAQIDGLKASLVNARSELERTQELIKKGVSTVQRLDQLRTQVDVLTNQITASEAQRAVIEQQEREGTVLAPIAGRVLTVPVTKNSVIMGGEPVATIGGGGFFIRLAIPERHADLLEHGAEIEISRTNGDLETTGHLAKIYPEIDNGRVIADVEVDDLETKFVNARVLVRVPVGERSALLIPQEAIETRYGVDYVTVMEGGEAVERTVISGGTVTVDDKAMIEILTGLKQGDEVELP
jgi:RND family efflux transporter MFP subunit